jgi:hypothetical protein
MYTLNALRISGRRGIPIAMKVDYLKKARGKITAKIENVEIPNGISTYDLSLDLFDQQQEVVCKFVLSFNIDQIPNAKSKKQI